jgi:hypothetical protein
LTRIHISGINPGDGFVTNEIWLRNYTGVSSWIELGYTQDPRPLHYFWAQSDETGLFTPHDLGDIPPEEFDTPVTFSIHQLQPGQFEVRIDGTRTHFTTATHVALWSGTDGGYAEIGQELSGTTGANAHLAVFDHNRALSRNSQWSWFTNPNITNPAATTEGKPPYGEWLALPATDASEGGVSSTHCCSQTI